MTTISLYPHIKETKKYDKIPIDIFLDYIRDGKWQDAVLPIRAMDKDARDAAKKKVPYVTLSGMFEDRKDSGAATHSGFIGIDIDNVDPEETKSLVCADRYVYAAFTSISGRGLCVLFRINGEKHREAFGGISEYLYENYGLLCDPTSVNPSRARFVSFDPHIFLNPSAPKFTIYPKIKAPKKVEQIVFTQTDFDTILQEIQRRHLNLCENYSDWVRIGFAFADRFGEGGRNAFHVVSQFSSKYKPTDTDKQYSNCMKAHGSKISTISTFYYYCKQAGIQTYSAETRTVLTAAVNGKKSGLDQATVAKNLKKFENIEADEQVIKQVFENNIQNSGDDPLISKVEQWLKHEYDLRRNIISRRIELNGAPLDDQMFNDIWRSATKVFDKITSEMLQRIIYSSFAVDYNPFLSFFEQHSGRRPSGQIDALFNTILSEDHKYTSYFGKKWMVGIISTIYGKHSPLMLVLSGTKQGTGKTEFFRRILPTSLLTYYAESKLDAGKDDEILMTQKLLIMDDEMGGKSKKDELKIKELLSRQTFSLREPYGRNNVDLNRLAVLCGTTNNEDILNDPTGNRRILPVPVFAINHADYNAINKVDVVMEAYNLYHAGFNWQLTADDIEMLKSKTGRFEKHSLEYELLNKHFSVPEKSDASEYMTATDIKNYLETHSVQKIILDRVGKELQRNGFKQEMKKINGNVIRVYNVNRLQQVNSTK